MPQIANIPVFEVTVESRYDNGYDDVPPGTEEHDVTISVGGHAVFSRTYTEKADQHHGDHDWDPVAHFGEIGISQFGYTLAQIVRKHEES